MVSFRRIRRIHYSVFVLFLLILVHTIFIGQGCTEFKGTESNPSSLHIDDREKPSVEISSPSNGANLSGTVSVSALASDNIDVVGVQFLVDRNAYLSEVMSEPYTISLNTLSLSNGSHTISAIARDSAGNEATSEVVTINIDNEGEGGDTEDPSVELTAPSNGSTVSGSITLMAEASDNIGVVGVQFTVDGNNIGSEVLAPPYTMTLDTTTLHNGAHTFRARARDAAGRTKTSTQVNVTVDNHSEQGQPDIIIILADDLGSTDIGPVRRKTGLLTPNIDRLRNAGTTYYNGYGAPVCVQARALLMAGRWQQRRSVGAVINNGPQPPSSVVMLPERLKALGYETSLVGKWHLGQANGKHPLDQGFDSYLGTEGNPNVYVGHDPNMPLIRGRTKIENVGNITDTFGNEAVRIINTPRSRPLYLQLSFHATHDPLHGTLASVAAKMDDNIGKVVAAAYATAEASGRGVPLIFFAGDNPRFDNAPFKGKKYDIWEGGVRVPFTMVWKGHVQANKMEDAPASLGDIAVTAIHAAGGDFSATDFTDLNQPMSYERPIYFKAMYDDPGVAVREGDWKLYLNYKGIAEALYNIKSDPGETINMAASKSDTVNRLRIKLEAFRRALND